MQVEKSFFGSDVCSIDMARSSCRARKRHSTSLQDGRGHYNQIAAYLLPFALGLLVGSALVCLAYLECWIGQWACHGQEREVQVLIPNLHLPQSQSEEIQLPEVQNEWAEGDKDDEAGQKDIEDDERKSPISKTLINETLTFSVLPNTSTTTTYSCPNRPLHLVILVLSAPSASLRRTAIRGTWVHDYRNRVVQVTTKFLIGSLELEAQKMSGISQEQEMFGDVLLLKDLKDSYANLSRKVLLGMRWTDENLNFDFLVKVDDDSYVRVEKLAEYLREIDCDQRLYWGYFMGHAFPEPTGKWAEHNWFICPHYLPYAMGGGYVLSRRIVRTLMKVSNRLTLYNNEDVTVGSWLAPYQLHRKHDVRFNVESVSHGCNNGYFISHKERVRTFYTKYTNLMKDGTLCDEEKETHPAYVYNWTSSPLDCCQRKKGIPVL